MKRHSSSRREILKKLASGGVLSALGGLRSGSLLGESHGAPPSGSIPGTEGLVVRRGDATYESWRQAMVWHLSKPDRYPDVIVQATSTDDVIAAVKYAAANNLKVTTRAGGHNATGASLRDGGLLVDVSRLNDVQIDPERQIALVEPGTKSLQLTSRAGTEGLSFPVPHCPSVGIGGFVLGGGIGLNFSHRGGFASFSIAGAEIVTADGELVMASPDENPDLYWAVRGAGPGFFGVVTRFHLQLYPTPAGVQTSSYILPLDAVETVTSSLDELYAGKDDRVEVLAIMMHSPEAPPDATGGAAKVCLVTAFAFGDSVDEARTMLEPYARSPLARESVVKEEFQETSYPGLYRFFGLDQVGGALGRYAVDCVLTDEPGKALPGLAEHFKSTPSPGNHVLTGYGMDLEQRDDACLSSIANHYIGCFIVWQDIQQDEANFEWLDGTQPLMDPYAKGHYINEIEARRHPERIRACFSETNWEKLQAVRKQYDPDGVFHTYLGYS